MNDLQKKQLDLLKEYEDKELVLGIRPESIFFKGDANNAKPSNILKSICDYAELLGRELVIYSNINGQKVIIKSLIENDVGNNDKIEFCFNNDDLYFFDKESSRRIK